MIKTIAKWGSIKAQIAAMDRGQSCTFATRKAAENFRCAAIRIGVAVSVRGINRHTYQATHCGPYRPREKSK